MGTKEYSDAALGYPFQYGGLESLKPQKYLSRAVPSV